MSRRLVYYLAAAALLLGIAASAIWPTAVPSLAGIDVRTQGTEVSVRAEPRDGGILLAGLKTRSTGTEVSY